MNSGSGSETTGRRTAGTKCLHEPEAAGKRAYVQFLRDRFDNDFTRFKPAYRLEEVDSFDDLLSYDFNGLELTRKDIRSDDEAFLAKIAERTYQLTRQAFDRFDPGAVVMSEKFKMHDHTDAILRIAAQYTDVISVQPGPTQGPDVGQGPDESEFNRAYWRHLHEVTGRPIFICDHAVSFSTPGFQRTLWHQVESDEAAARHYDNYLERIAAEPYMPGYQRCQYKSRYDGLRTLLKQGLLDLDGQPYNVLVRQIRDTNRRVLRRFGNDRGSPREE